MSLAYNYNRSGSHNQELLLFFWTIWPFIAMTPPHSVRGKHFNRFLDSLRSLEMTGGISNPPALPRTGVVLRGAGRNCPCRPCQLIKGAGERQG